MNRKRIYFGIASILLLLLFIWGSYNVLKNETPYIPENTVSAMDNERSQVYVSGKDYNLETEVQKKHQETEQKRSRILEEQERNNTQNSERKRPVKTGQPQRQDDRDRQQPRPPVRPQDDNNEDDDDDPDERSHYGRPEEEQKLAPIIKTSLVTGDVIKGDLKFRVAAKDNEGRFIPAFSNGQGKVVVLLNGAKVTSTSDDGTWIKYSVKAKNGKNTVKITAYDRKGRTRTITRKVTVKPEEEKEKTGVATVKVGAPSIGKPNIMSTNVEFKEGDTVEEVVKEALKKKGFSSNWSGGYLSKISKGGMINGWKLSDSMMEYITERGAESKLVDPEKVDTGELGDNDIIKQTGSGWNYSVNGSFPNVGMNAMDASDGSVIQLVFSLFSDRGDLSH